MYVRPVVVFLSTFVLMVAMSEQAGLQLDSEVVAQLQGLEDVHIAVADRLGNLCAGNQVLMQISCYSASGQLRWSRGGLGQNPGQFTLLFRLAIAPGGDVYAYDRQRQEITHFDRNGGLVRAKRLPFSFFQVDGILVRRDGVLVIAGLADAPSLSGNAAVHVFSSDLRHLGSFGPVPDAKDRALLRLWGTGGVSLAGPAEDIVFTRKLPYEVYVYSVRGAVRRMFAAALGADASPDDGFEISGSAGSMTVSSRSRTAFRPLRAFEVSDRRLLAGHADSTGVYWHLFDQTGKLVGSERIPPSWRVRAGYDAVRDRVLVVSYEHERFQLLGVKVRSIGR